MVEKPKKIKCPSCSGRKVTPTYGMVRGQKGPMRVVTGSRPCLECRGVGWINEIPPDEAH